MTVGPDYDLQADLAGQGAPKSHLERIGALRALFEQSPLCVAAALVGSYARRSGDRISDLDLVVFVEEGGARRFIDEAHSVLATTDVLDDYSGEHAGQGDFRKYVYLDFSSCEIHAFGVPTTFKLLRPFVAVWDPGDFLSGLVTDGPPPRHEEFDAYAHGDAGLIWELVDCIKWMKRGRHQLTKDYLRRLVAALDRHESPGAA